jgi:hypothetical protein
MPCHAMHAIQNLFLESFSYVLQFDMHFYMHSYVDKKFYSCKKVGVIEAYIGIEPHFNLCSYFFWARL